MRFSTVVFFLAITGMALNGCSILPEARPQEIYRLPPSAIVPVQKKSRDLSLRIVRPSAAGVLDSTRIVVVEENQYSVYQDARWNAPAPILWRNHLLDAFQKDGRLQRLSSGEDGTQTDLEIGGTLRAFQSEYRAGIPQVVISFDARLINAATKQILAARAFSIREPIQGVRVPEVVAAFGRGSDVLAQEVIGWFLDQVRGRE